MCLSTTNVTCGSCLAKWTGKKWDESYKTILSIKSWTLALKDSQLCVEGQCDLECKLVVCVPVTNRLNSYWVANNRTLLKLRGGVDTSKLPEYIAKKFSNGIPSNWKDIEKKWVEFVQQGERSSFPWDKDSSFASTNTSILLTRSRRTPNAGKNSEGKTKEKSIQRVSPHPTTPRPPRATESEKEPILHSTDETCVKDSQAQVEASPWAAASPFIPAYKIERISSWVDSAKQVRTPVLDGEIDTVGERGLQHAIRAHDASNSLSSKNKVRNLETVRQKSSNVVIQSTPNSVGNSKMKEALDVWNVSSIINNSTPSQSVDADFNDEDTFCKPKARGRRQKTTNLSPKTASTASMQPNAKNSEVPVSSSDTDTVPISDFLSEDFFRKPKSRGRQRPVRNVAKSFPSSSLSQSITKNSEVPGSLIGRMLAPLRPRRKQSSQKIERWRPVLGVDGNLKLQGYLLLQCDMTAGQILTTNSIVEWGHRKVLTCDGREYELVGEPYGKIPDEMKTQLLMPMDCAEITAKFMEYQSLKDRADWGAEYEYFYDDDGGAVPQDSHMSRDSQRLKKDKTRRSLTTRQQSKISGHSANSDNSSPTRRVEIPTIGRFTRTADKIDSPSSKMISVSEITPAPAQHQHNTSIADHSPILSSRRSIYQLQEGEVQNKGSALTSSQSSVKKTAQFTENLHQDKLNKSIEKNSNKGSTVRSCFENVTWRNSQNQMMMPSSRLANDTSIVDFSSSRIKVSYITPSPKDASKTVQDSFSIGSDKSLLSNSLSSNEGGSPKARPSRSPVKRSCFPCCDGSVKSSSNLLTPTSKSQSPPPSRSPRRTPHTSVPRRKSARIASKSPFSGHFLRSGNTRRKSAPASSYGTPSRSPILSPYSPRRSARKKVNKLKVNIKRLDPKKIVELKGKSVETPEPQPQSTQVSSIMSDKSAAEKDKKKPQKVLKDKKKPQKVLKDKKKPQKVLEEKNKNDKKNKSGETKKKKTVLKKKNNAPEKVKKKNPRRILDSSLESSEADDVASVCSDATDISIGPSASVIFALQDSATARRVPRTLKERRERDERIAKMGEKLAAKEAILDDDDPMASLIASHRFVDLPQEWCKHENLLKKNRKRRRPSSSDGTVSPSRSGFDDGFGNEDATSSVATPQLLMRPPDPKQVQSYLQRQRALNAKPQRPTRQMKHNREYELPDLDYAAVFRSDSSDSDEASAVSDNSD